MQVILQRLVGWWKMLLIIQSSGVLEDESSSALSSWVPVLGRFWRVERFCK